MAPGWYPDPFSGAGFLRWWDGTRWGTQTRLADVPPETAPAGLVPPSAAPAPGRHSPLAAPTAAAYPVASWGVRLAGFLLDLLVMSVVLVPAYTLALWPAFTDLVAAIPTDGSAVPVSAVADFQARILAMSLVLTAMSLVVTFAYTVPQNVAYGRTLGKRIVGIRVRAFAEDRPPRWGEAIVRWAVLWGGSSIGGVLFLLLDCLWPLWDKPYAQALHDKASRTVVVPR